MITNEYLNKTILVKDRLETTIVFAKKEESGNVLFFKKHMKKITFLDRVLTKIYEYPIKYLLDNKHQLKTNHIYQFFYIYDKEINSIKYKEKGLILSNVTFENKLVETKDDFLKLSSILKTNIDSSIIKLFIDINNLDKSTFLNIRNIKYNSFLKDVDYFNSIDIFILNDDNSILKKFSHLFEKPMGRYNNDGNILIIKDVINSVYDLNIFKYSLSEGSFYKKYVNLVLSIYKEIEDEYYKYDIEKPDILKHEVFSLNDRFFNYDFKNPDLFKLCLNIFKSKQKFDHFLFTEDDEKKYESIIYKIQSTLKGDFRTFKDFIK